MNKYSIWIKCKYLFPVLFILVFGLNCGSKSGSSSSGSQSPAPTVSDTNAPGLPGSFAAVAGGSTQINLSWTAASDDTSPQNAIVYEICQSSVSGGCATFTANQKTTAGATTASASGLSPLTTYYFVIRAIDQAGNIGAASTQIPGTTDVAGVVNDPTFSPVAGVYGSTQSVTISSTTGVAAVCYTADGSTPSCNTSGGCATGTLYSSVSKVNVASTQTLNAIACATGYTSSNVTSAAYTIDTTAPSIPTGLIPVVAGANQINLSWTAATDNVSASANIVYQVCKSAVTSGCTDASFTVLATTGAGATSYSAMALNAQTQYFFKVRAVDEVGNVGQVSLEATATTQGFATAPAFSPVAGTYTVGQDITITSATALAAICYTQGSTPANPVCDSAKTGCTSGTKYTMPVQIPASQSIKAIACLTGAVDSNITSAAYTINTAATPTISPVSGSYLTSQLITMSSASSSIIHYTIDGTTPNVGSAKYAGPFALTSAKTIKAISIYPGISLIATATYTIANVSQVDFSILPGNYAAAQNVALSTSTAGATIFYTTDNTIPATVAGGSTSQYTGAIAVSANTTIKAIAVVPGYNNSPVTSATYTIGGAASYALGGWVSGLYGGTLVLQNNGGDNLTLTGNGPFVFPTPLADTATYAVTVLTQPSPQACRVDVDNGGTATGGTIAGANFLSISVVCGPVSLPVADTGQTSCWDTVGTLLACLGLGHDGSFTNRPKARSFTGPTQHATYTSDYTTTDNVTGLVWKTCSEGQAIGTSINCQGVSATSPFGATTATWIDAGLQCRALNDLNSGAGYAGRKDWRLPSIKELESLANYEIINPSIDTSRFPATVVNPYWSSSTNVVSAARAFVFHFGTSNIISGIVKASATFYVRCVSN